MATLGKGIAEALASAAPIKYTVSARKHVGGPEILLHESNNEAQAWWIFETNQRLKKYATINICFNRW